MKLKSDKKFSDLSKNQKIYVIVLTSIVIAGILFLIFNLRDIMTTEYIFEDEAGNKCIEVYEYGKLVTPECTEMRERINQEIRLAETEERARISLNLS